MHLIKRHRGISSPVDGLHIIAVDIEFGGWHITLLHLHWHIQSIQTTNAKNKSCSSSRCKQRNGMNGVYCGAFCSVWLFWFPLGIVHLLQHHTLQWPTWQFTLRQANEPKHRLQQHSNRRKIKSIQNKYVMKNGFLVRSYKHVASMCDRLAKQAKRGKYGRRSRRSEKWEVNGISIAIPISRQSAEELS